MKNIQLLVLGVITCGTIFSGYAQVWMPTGAPNTSWSGIASSGDGQKLMASVWGGGIYSSTNSGATWAQTIAPDETWSAIACSADGNKLVASVFNSGSIYISTNSGIRWQASTAPAEDWSCVASSVDGAILLAGHVDSSGGGLYVSTNSGGLWQPVNAPTDSCGAVAESADGSFQIAVYLTGLIYTSTNYGTTWISNSVPSLFDWRGVACSADGTRLAVVSLENAGIQGAIYISTNSGTSWMNANAPSNSYNAIAASADGTKFVAVIKEPQDTCIFTSMNSGATWVSNNVPFAQWYAVASSADGGRLAAAAIGPYGNSLLSIYTSQTVVSPQIYLNILPNNLTFSWLIPSTNFVLQQSSDLANWSVVTNLSALNLTNLQNQVSLPLSADNSFYRLKTP